MEPEWNHGNGNDDATLLGLRDALPKIYINLDQNFDTNSLCNRIINMLNNCISKKIDLSHSILCIEIKESIEQNSNKYIENRV